MTVTAMAMLIPYKHIARIKSVLRSKSPTRSRHRIKYPQHTPPLVHLFPLRFRLHHSYPTSVAASGKDGLETCQWGMRPVHLLQGKSTHVAKLETPPYLGRLRLPRLYRKRATNLRQISLPTPSRTEQQHHHPGRLPPQHSPLIPSFRQRHQLLVMLTKKPCSAPSLVQTLAFLFRRRARVALCPSRINKRYHIATRKNARALLQAQA